MYFDGLSLQEYKVRGMHLMLDVTVKFLNCVVGYFEYFSHLMAGK